MTNKFQQLHGKATIFFNESDIDNLQENLLDWFSRSITHEETTTHNQEDRIIQFAAYKRLSLFLRDAHKAVNAV